MVYLEKASEQALLRDSSFKEAEDFLTRLLAMAEQLPETSKGECALLWPEGGERATRARWTRMLSQSLVRQGRHGAGMEQLERSIHLLGQNLPSSSVTDRLEFAGGIARRLLFRPPAIERVRRTAREQLELLETARVYDAFVQLLYLGVPARVGAARQDADVTLLSGLALLRAVRAAERAGPSAELSRAYSVFANIVAMFRRQALASDYAARARSIAQDVGDRHAQFRALTIGQLPSFIRGDWAESASALERGLALGEELRATHECLISACNLALVSLNQGRLDEASRQFHAINQRATAREDVVPQLWALVGLGESAFRRGNLAQALDHAEASVALAERTKTVDQNGRFQAHGLLASIFVRRGELERARSHATAATAAAIAGARLSYSPQSGFVGVAEALFALMDHDQSNATKRELKRWLRSLRVIAFCRPILEPWHHVYRARWLARRGQLWRARRHLRRGVAAADRMHLPYEGAIARLEFARLLTSGSVAAAQLVDQARIAFEGMGAAQKTSGIQPPQTSGKTHHLTGVIRDADRSRGDRQSSQGPSSGRANEGLGVVGSVCLPPAGPDLDGSDRPHCPSSARPLLDGTQRAVDLADVGAGWSILGMALVSLAAFTTTSTLLASSWCTIYNAPARFNVDCIPSVKFPIRWPERVAFGTLALPTIYRATLISSRESGVSSLFLLTGAALGLGLTALTVLWTNRTTAWLSRDVARPQPRTWVGRRLKQVIVWLAERGTGGDGFLEKGTGEIRDGHVLAWVGWSESFALYAVIGISKVPAPWIPNVGVDTRVCAVARTHAVLDGGGRRILRRPLSRAGAWTVAASPARHLSLSDFRPFLPHIHRFARL